MSAAELRARALAAARAGDFEAAASLFEEAIALHPRDAALLNSAGGFYAGRDRPDRALRFYDQALAVAADYAEAALNRAVVLSKMGRDEEARDWLHARESTLRAEPRYWSARAAAERSAGDRTAAASSYDACLRLDPSHARAAHGRARVALERGEPDMVERYRAALATTPGDPQVWLGYAEALDYAGRASEARSVAERLVAQAPGWTDALELLARLRWAAGEGLGFCDHYPGAVARAEGDPAPWRSWCRMLAGVDEYAEAAKVAARAHGAFPRDPLFALMEAVHAGEAGDDARAEAIFATHASGGRDWLVNEARHRLRRREFDRAESLLADALATDGSDVAAWALRDLGWRATGDSRTEWLHGNPAFSRLLDLDLTSGELAKVVGLLDRLHDDAPVPVGQSVRSGTQTRGALFDRTDTELAPLRRAIGEALERYRAVLPHADPAHPLLARRDQPWTIVGSWSIRLFGGGRHAHHIHPQGLVSSATYLVVPPADLPGDGALELGRPPSDLRLDLPPVSVLRPLVGRLALFPSTLYHGTRPFANGKRMTVAFDVQAP